MTIVETAVAVAVLLVVAFVLVAAQSWTVQVREPDNRSGSRAERAPMDTATRRFRWILAIAFTLCLAFLLGLGPVLRPGVAVAGTSGATILLAAIVRPRAPHGRKAEGDWASLPAPVGWFVASIVVTGTVANIGLGLFDQLPDSIPTHWTANGTADSFSPKTIWTVEGPLIVSVAAVLCMFVLSFLNRAVSIQSDPQATPAANILRATKMQAEVGSLLGRLMLTISVIGSTTSLVGWLAPGSGWLISTISFALVGVIALILITFWIRWKRLKVKAPDRGSRESSQKNQP